MPNPACPNPLLKVGPTLPPGWEGGGYEGNKKCVPKMGLSFLALYSKFHFSPEENCFGFGWVGGSAGPQAPKWVAKQRLGLPSLPTAAFSKAGPNADCPTLSLDRVTRASPEWAVGTTGALGLRFLTSFVHELWWGDPAMHRPTHC